MSRACWTSASTARPTGTPPYVGESAFAHKGGLHVSAVEKDPRTYEHIEPATVGNRRTIVVSDQAGRSNILARFREIGIEIDAGRARSAAWSSDVKAREHDGYAYDGAEASFELLARRALGRVPDFFALKSFRVDRRAALQRAGASWSPCPRRRSSCDVGGQSVMTVAEGNGPVNALDSALRKALLPVYPQLEDMRLVDYKVRILTPQDGTEAVTRVMIESTDGHGRALVDGRRLGQRDRRLLQRAARRHHLEAVPRRRAQLTRR